LLADTLRGFCGSSDRPISIYLFSCPAPAATTRGSGGGRLLPIRFAALHHGPHHAGHLVGQSHRCELTRRRFSNASSQAYSPPRPGFMCRITAVVPALTAMVRRFDLGSRRER
jgi:hypothetical protein